MGDAASCLDINPKLLLCQLVGHPLTRAAILQQSHVIIVPTRGAAQPSGRTLALATAADAHVMLRTSSLMVGPMVIQDTDAVLSAA